MHARATQGFDLELRAGFPDARQKAAHAESGARWRVDRLHTPEKQPMATKLNILTCLQQAQGLAEVSYRFPQPHPLGWFVVQAPPLQAAERRRLRVAIDIQNPQATPFSVRIVHAVKAASCSPAPGSAR